MNYLDNTHFEGASGPVQFIGANRQSNIEITQFSSVVNQCITVGHYFPNKNESERLLINETAVRWLSGGKPSDGSQGKVKLSFRTSCSKIKARTYGNLMICVGCRYQAVQY